jgi:hypothetical protein
MGPGVREDVLAKGCPDIREQMDTKRKLPFMTGEDLSCVAYLSLYRQKGHYAALKFHFLSEQ